MKFIILSALLLVNLAFSTARHSGRGSGESGSGEGGWGGWGGWGGGGSTCPTVTPAPLATDPFTYTPWYLAQRSPSSRGSAPTCVTYSFGTGYGSPVNHDLIIARRLSYGTDLSVSILSQTSAASAAGTFESWTNIHSTDDSKAPSAYSVLGMDSAVPPTWVVLYYCQPGGANVRILTSVSSPSAATIQAAQDLVASYNIPGVNLVSVSNSGC